MARPHPDWVASRWSAKAAWHDRQRSQTMREKVAAVIRIQQRQQSVVATKRAMGMVTRDAVVWQTKP